MNTTSLRRRTTWAVLVLAVTISRGQYSLAQAPGNLPAPERAGVFIPSVGPTAAEVGRTVSGLISFNAVLVQTEAGPALRGTEDRAEGTPLAGVFDVVFRIHDHWETGRVVWSERHEAQQITGGKLALNVGAQHPIPEDVFASPWRWLGVALVPVPAPAVEPPELQPRFLLSSWPYAFRTRDAEKSQFAASAAVAGFAQGVAHDSLPARAMLLSANPADAALLAKGYVVRGTVAAGGAPAGRGAALHVYEKTAVAGSGAMDSKPLGPDGTGVRGWLLGGPASDLAAAARQAWEEQKEQSDSSRGDQGEAAVALLRPSLPLNLGLYFLVACDFAPQKNLVNPFAAGAARPSADPTPSSAVVYPVVCLSKDALPLCLRPHTAAVRGIWFERPNVAPEAVATPAIDQTRSMIEQGLLASPALRDTGGTCQEKYTEVQAYIGAMLRLLTGDSTATLRGVLAPGFVWATAIETLNVYSPVPVLGPPEQAILPGGVACFNAGGSFDFDTFGNAGLTYAWDFDWVAGTTFTADPQDDDFDEHSPYAQHLYDTAGVYHARVQVSDGVHTVASAATASVRVETGTRPDPPVIFIAIDAFSPEYLALNKFGNLIAPEYLPPGKTGVVRPDVSTEPLVKSIRSFLAAGTHFADARDYLPAATDMNHFNTIACASSSRTGILGVSTQTIGWDALHRAVEAAPHSSWAYDGNGTKVETLFNLVKKAWPESKTAYISGKFWIGNMYVKNDESAYDPQVDLVVTTKRRPDYVPDAATYIHPWCDPETDEDAECDPESELQRAMTGNAMAQNPVNLTPDRWTVDAALAVLENEQPDLAVILLAQIDDSHHLLGAAWDLEDVGTADPAYDPPDTEECNAIQGEQRDGWQKVSKRNPHAFREPILDQVRDMDENFGRLIAGIRALPRYTNARIVLYSDHGHITHLVDRGWVPGQGFTPSTNFIQLLIDAGVLKQAEYENGVNFWFFSGTSGAYLYFYPTITSTDADKAAKIRAAYDVLFSYEAVNPSTQRSECPWSVLTYEQMRDGLVAPDEYPIPGEVIASPGELDHRYFNDEYYPENTLVRKPIWPDIFLLFRNGWQAPVYQGQVGNLGVDLPDFTPPFAGLLGGHGGPDTQRILLAIAGAGIRDHHTLWDRPMPASEPTTPAVYSRNYRNADMAKTVAEMYGLKFPHDDTAGTDRQAEISSER